MRKILSAIIIMAICISMIGCVNTGSESGTTTGTTPIETPTDGAPTDGTPKDGKELDIDQSIQALAASGLNAKKGRVLSAGLVGAVEAYVCEIDGKELCIWRFDLNSKVPLAVENIKSLKESDKMNMDLQQWPYEVTAKINNNLVISGYEAHPNKDKILEVFTSLK